MTVQTKSIRNLLLFAVPSTTTLAMAPFLLEAFSLPKLTTFAVGILCLLFVFKISNIIHKKNFERLVYLSIIFGIFFLIFQFCSGLVRNQNLVTVVFGSWGRNNGFLSYLLLFLLFVIFMLHANRSCHRQGIMALLMLNLLLVPYGFIQIIRWDFVSWDYLDIPLVLTLGNVNFAANFIVFGVIATYSLFFDSQFSLRFKSSLSILFGIQLFLIYKSDSFQSFVILFFGITVFSLIYFVRSSHFAHKFFATLFALSIMIGTTLLAVGLLGSGPFGRVLPRYLISFQDRIYFWEAALGMIRTSPLNGVGLDSYGDFYRLFRSRESVLFRGTPSTGVDNAHNVFLQLGATAGIPAMIFYVLLISSITIAGLRVISKEFTDIYFIAIFTIWIVFIFQQQVSIDTISLSSWGWCFAGLIMNRFQEIFTLKSRNSEQNLKRKHSFFYRDFISALARIAYKYSQGFVSAILSILIFYCLNLMSDEYNLKRNITDMIYERNLPSRELYAEQTYSVARNSRIPQLRILASDYLVNSNEVDRALKLGKSLTLDFPNNPNGWDIVASIYEQTKFPKKAIYYRKKTIELDPFNFEIRKGQ